MVKILCLGMGGGILIIRFAFVTTSVHFLFSPKHQSSFILQKLFEATTVDKWAVVNFSARCDMRSLVRDLIKCGNMKGIVCILFFYFIALFRSNFAL